jgi:tetratricopeptide (TPR) repeat protein
MTVDMTIKAEDLNPLLHDAWTMALTGNEHEARQLFRAALSKNEDDADAQEGLAVLGLGLDLASGARIKVTLVPEEDLERARDLYRSGDVDGANRACADMLTAHPDDPNVLGFAGEIALVQQRLDDALALFNMALERFPFHLRSLLGRGAVFLEKDDRRERRVGDGGEAAEDYLEQAMACYRVLKAQHGDLAIVHVNMGLIHQRRKRLTEARTCYEKALEVEPGDTDATLNLGGLLLTLGRPEEARARIEDALARDPDNVNALLNLGVYYRQWGDKDKALEIWDKLLKIHPDTPAALENVSDLRVYTPDHPEIAHMRALWAQDWRPNGQRRGLAAALYNALSRSGQEDEAIPFLWEANRLRNLDADFNIAAERKRHESIKALFAGTATLPKPTVDETAPRVRPIFIVGLPRSGSTMTEQILASHSQVQGIGEAPCFPAAVQTALSTATRWGKPILTDETATALREQYMRGLAERDVTKPVVVDKMLWNYRHIGFIFSAFPDAKVIIMDRDPMAIGWSIWKLFFAENGPEYAYDLTSIGQSYRLLEDLTAFWLKRFPGRVHQLCYERMTEHQEEETRALLDYCELPWEDACMRFHETKRSVNTASNLQVKKAMYKGSSDAWKRHAAALAPLSEALAAPLPAATESPIMSHALVEAMGRGARGDFQGAHDILEVLVGGGLGIQDPRTASIAADLIQGAMP